MLERATTPTVGSKQMYRYHNQNYCFSFKTGLGSSKSNFNIFGAFFEKKYTFFPSKIYFSIGSNDESEFCSIIICLRLGNRTRNIG